MLGKELAVRSVEPQLRKLTPTEADQVFDATQARIMETEAFGQRPSGLIALAKVHAALQTKLLNVIRQIPTAKLGTWATTGFEAVFSEPLKSEYLALRKAWETQDTNKQLQAAAKATTRSKK